MTPLGQVVMTCVRLAGAGCGKPKIDREWYTMEEDLFISSGLQYADDDGLDSPVGLSSAY